MLSDLNKHKFVITIAQNLHCSSIRLIAQTDLHRQMSFTCSRGSVPTHRWRSSDGSVRIRSCTGSSRDAPRTNGPPIRNRRRPALGIGSI